MAPTTLAGDQLLAPSQASAAPPPPASSPRGEPSSGAFYRPELDALRFFAFLAVFLNHTLRVNLATAHHRLASAGVEQLSDAVARLGRWGVDLFFVLSAYLITELLLRERERNGCLDVRKFYARRALRIWPLYFLFLAFVVLLHYLDRQEQMTWKYALGFFFFAGNWLYIVKPIATIAGPLWSVSIEEQFYLLWPLVVRFASRRQIRWLAVGLVVLAFLARLALVRAGDSAEAIYRNTFCRLDPIAAGILVALLLRGRVPDLRPLQRLALGAAGIWTLVAVNRFFHLLRPPLRLGNQLVGYPLVAFGCTAILLAVLGASGPFTSLPRCQAFVYMGRISYGLYVFHQLGLRLADRLVPTHSTSITLFGVYWFLGLTSTIAMAAVSYRWIEQPFLRLKQRKFTVSPPRAGGNVAC